MTPYRRYNTTDNDIAPTQPSSKGAPVLEIQCIIAVLLLTAFFLCKSLLPEVYTTVSAFLQQLSAKTSFEQQLGAVLSETVSYPTLPGDAGVSDLTVQPDSVVSEASSAPGSASLTDPAALIEGLQFTLSNPGSYSVLEYQTEAVPVPETVAVYGDLVPVSLLTETDKTKTESFAEKAAGGLLQAPTGCSFDAFFPDVKLSSPLTGRITSRFGYRYHPLTGLFGFHTGVDIAADAGSAIYAAAAGTVTERGYDDVWGNYLVITHSDSTQTFYAHCKKLYKRKGASVKAGEKIALVGSTGWSTGPHLHFEVRYKGVCMDPEWIL